MLSNKDMQYLLTAIFLCFSVDTIFLVSYLIEQDIGIAASAAISQKICLRDVYPNDHLSPPSLTLQLYKSVYRTRRYTYLTNTATVLVYLMSIFLWRMQLYVLFVHPSEYRVSRLSLHPCISRRKCCVRVSGEEYKFQTYLFNSSHIFTKFLSVIFQFSAWKFVR